eukprot:1177365-Amphidinium_carterae.1
MEIDVVIIFVWTVIIWLSCLRAMCDSCDPGWFATDSALSACDPCPAGTQAESEGSSYCAPT